MKHLFSVFIVFLFIGYVAECSAQITTITASGQTMTNYPSGDQYLIYIFCGQQGVPSGSLTAQFSTGETADFEWFQYNSQTGLFEARAEFDQSAVVASTAPGLEDGCYRVKVTAGGQTETYTAWVLNSWYVLSAEISEVTCDYFRITGEITDQAVLEYTDLAGAGTDFPVQKIVQARWESGSEALSTLLSPTIYYPPSSNTTYELTVYDDLGCSATTSVYYESVVPKADFTASPESGEAPLEVSFSNQSQNADEYEWFFFRDIAEIRAEAASEGSVADSIMDVALDVNPIYTYENSGEYKVKMVATKQSGELVCHDTLYLDYYIKVDTSYIDAPNFFTPNGDGTNDKFKVYFSSMKSIDIKIFNRWGKRVYGVSRNNLGTFNSDGEELAWDGRIGGRMASPGVYYYVVEGRGRDDRKWHKSGFFHLFRSK
ncbi:gliding motility-associated C-terminal domain-containing protein [Mangrovibacterium marinum]|uniref:Gliding motility-associated-like protein n=1 Tax=Mangrovibacterium marinum TaxID=1639118 RepID=A0A2T5C5Q1_9BACT|nr:gliding motility-associated C-terminal domain-containing protein [Mangrovibacterium marinum]PTN10211.1 gliding motility-associated-like protein [Mangrovibacterium marinum]